MKKTKAMTAFGLKAPPFSKEVLDKDLWLPPSKRELVEEIVEAVSERQSVLLTGEPGTGKTCVLRAVRYRLPGEGFRLTYCHNATLGRRDFYRQLCLALGLTPSATAAAVFYAVSTHVSDLAKDRVYPAFLLDEAHLLHQDTLDHLHILLNYEWDSKALLSLILVGLPELRDRLDLRRNRSLCSRIHRRISIDALTPEDTAAYVEMRLTSAGCSRQLFSSDALALLHEHTFGAMRDIDRTCDTALRIAANRKNKLVDRDVIAHVIDEHS
jgi:general secretion pathway protein A